MHQDNRGYITIEVSMLIPIFLFFMLGMSGIYMIIMAEAHIHQALASATDYIAQYCYLENKLINNTDEEMHQSEVNAGNLVNTALVIKQFQTYLGDDFYVEQMLDGGKKGIVITVKSDTENSKIMIVSAFYQIKINLPLLGTYSIYLSDQIKQKAFVGFSKEEYINSDDCFVYVTPNREVYHMRRDCTHLVLDVDELSKSRKQNYDPCFYCGSGKEGDVLYVAKSGEVYHGSRDCVGLRRTVTRVKLSTVKGIAACSRCSR